MHNYPTDLAWVRLPDKLFRAVLRGITDRDVLERANMFLLRRGNSYRSRLVRAHLNRLIGLRTYHA